MVTMMTRTILTMIPQLARHRHPLHQPGQELRFPSPDSVLAAYVYVKYIKPYISVKYIQAVMFTVTHIFVKYSYIQVSLVRTISLQIKLLFPNTCLISLQSTKAPPQTINWSPDV